MRRGFSLKAIIAGCRSWRGLGLQPHMARWSLLVACLSLAAAAALQLPSASAPGTLSRTVWTTPSTQLRARVVAAGAAPQIAKPKTIIKPKTGGAKPATPDQKLATAQPKLQRKSEDCPMWKVLLLGDEEYEEDPVCEVLLAVIPEIENRAQAGDKYQEAQASGKALLLTVPKEQAEHYVEQLIRSEPMVYGEIEED